MEAVVEEGQIVPDIESKFEQFFRTYYYDEIQKISHYPDANSFYIDFDHLIRYSSALADEAIENPDSALPAAEKALKNLVMGKKGIIEPSFLKINLRFNNLPSSQKVMIKDIRRMAIGKLISVEGIVRKATDVRPKLVVGAYGCQCCGHINRIHQAGANRRGPSRCEGCDKPGPFNLLDQESVFVDSQKVMIQENLDDLRGGEHPKQLNILLEDDLSGKITPGNRIEFVGILRAVSKQFKDQKSRIFELFLEANNYAAMESDFEEVKITKEEEAEIIDLSKDPQIYEKIKSSIAPHIYGYSDIKEAIMYQLFSSPALQLPDGGRIRGDSHIIIMGEPATGKSEILQYVAKELAPRGIYTSGKGTSSAGLTATAVKDEFGDGGWSLEAGALVLADRGMACIDEFDKMEPEDRSAMHEAMEQQSVSIAKAGMLATFRARCSILAAANPKYGRFDDYKSMSEQVNLPPTILSRFDLIFFVRDVLEDTREVARHILETVTSPESITPILEPLFLRKYIAYARQNVIPVLDEEAKKRVEEFYVEMRAVAKDAKDVPIPLTARQLWAILRIARAASRVRLSTRTTLEDVERAINLVKISLKQAFIDIETGKVDVDSIMVGVTKTQRDRLTHILDIIKGLEKEYGTAKKAEILEQASKEGVPEREAEKAIEKLKLDGHIFEPKYDVYKST